MLRSRPLLVAARDGPKRSGRSWGSVAGYSVASAAVIVSFPVMLWPVVDGIVLPRVFRWAFEKKKHVQAVPQPGTGRILVRALLALFLERLSSGPCPQRPRIGDCSDRSSSVCLRI
mmetsp:Transcript_4822/g.10046  ORF Transcript_4822/g.10046 Transcript_4822/m.10046 type:complete len:116 (-) Transcript_4822:594-941(-)